MPADAVARRNDLDTHSCSVVFKLRLKPGCSSLQNALKQPQVFEVLSNEYVAQYLEHIGARPSKATAELVRANAPLTAACVKAGHKAEGLADNELLLTAPAVQLDAPVRPLVPKHHAEQVAAVLAAAKHCTAKLGHRQMSSRQGNAPAVYGDEDTSTRYGFQGMSASKMYPFNIKQTLARAEIASKAAAAADLASTSGCHGAAGSQESHKQHQACRSADAGAMAAMQSKHSSFAAASGAVVQEASHISTASAVLSSDALAELLQDFRPDHDHIMGIQEAFGSSLQQWFQGLSPGVTVGQVDAQEVAATATLLVSAGVMKLTITLLYWLYHEFVVGSPAFPAHPSMQYGAKRASAPRPRPTQRGRPTSKTRAPPEHYDLGFQLLVQQHLERSEAAAQAAATCHVDPNSRTVRLGSRQASMDSSRVSFTGAQRPSATGSSAQQQVAALGTTDGSRAPSTAGSAMPAASRQLPPNHRTATDAAHSARNPQQMLQQQASFRRQSNHSSASGTSSSTQALAPAAEAAIAASLSTAQGMKQLQQCRLVALLQQWQQLQDELKRSRVGLFFMLPVLLLSLRALTEQLFASAFAAWLRSPHGAAAAAAMDSALLQLLDPSGYHSQMPLLQSTPAAVRLCQSFPRRWHAQELSHYSDTSTLIKAAVGEPASAEARRMLAQQGGPRATSRRVGSGSYGSLQGTVHGVGDRAGDMRLQLSAKLEQDGQQQLLRQTLPLKLRTGRL